jgi:hypothetical protein
VDTGVPILGGDAIDLGREGSCALSTVCLCGRAVPSHDPLLICRRHPFAHQVYVTAVLPACAPVIALPNNYSHCHLHTPTTGPWACPQQCWYLTTQHANSWPGTLRLQVGGQDSRQDHPGGRALHGVHPARAHRGLWSGTAAAAPLTASLHQVEWTLSARCCPLCGSTTHNMVVLVCVLPWTPCAACASLGCMHSPPDP